MFASLLVGLERLVEFPDWSAVAVLPVDHPLVKSHTVNTLLNFEEQAVIPSFKGKHGHPVRLDRGVVEQIVNGSLEGPTLRDVLKKIKAVDVKVDDPGVVSNCNTPEALAAALKGMTSP
jgi:CTP:molybdopterin cytidylyltransferase MocA